MTPGKDRPGRNVFAMGRSGRSYTGICIDPNSSPGMCAERNAISTMFTQWEYEVEKVVAVYEDGTVFPPCGACREMMRQPGRCAKEIEVMAARDRG